MSESSVPWARSQDDEPDADGGEAEVPEGDLRGRARRRIGRLGERLAETRNQLDRARGRRDELEATLERMAEAEAAQREELKTREEELERRRGEAESSLTEAQERAAAAEQREAEARKRLDASLSEVEGEREKSRGLEAELAELRRQADQASAELEEQRAKLEQADVDRARADELEATVAELSDRVEQAEARSADEEKWHTELEARLAEAERQAEEVLTDIDEELEITLGRAALERERRVAAEARVAELESQLAEGVHREPDSVSPPEEQDLREPVPVEDAPPGPSEELARAEEEIEELKAALEDERARPIDATVVEEVGDDELVGELRDEVESLRLELTEARAQNEAGEQARRRVLQLENDLEEARNEEPDDAPREPTGRFERSVDAGDEGPRRGLFGGSITPEPESRAPVRDTSDISHLDDQELAQTFSSMREAARLADDRGDREAAQEHRAIARAAAEEAADRPNFGAERVRGRKRNRMMKELAAAREKALDRRPLSSTVVGNQPRQAD